MTIDKKEVNSITSLHIVLPPFINPLSIPPSLDPRPPRPPRPEVYNNLAQFSNLKDLKKRFEDISNSNQQRKWNRTLVICSIAIGIIGGMVYRLAYQSTYKYAALGVGSALFLVSLVIGRIIKPSPEYAKFMNSFKKAAKEAVLEIRTARDYKSQALCECLKRRKPIPYGTFSKTIDDISLQYGMNPTEIVNDLFKGYLLNPQQPEWRLAYAEMLKPVQSIALLKDQEIDTLPPDLGPVIRKVRTEAIIFIDGSTVKEPYIHYVQVFFKQANPKWGDSLKITSAQAWDVPPLPSF